MRCTSKVKTCWVRKPTGSSGRLDDVTAKGQYLIRSFHRIEEDDTFGITHRTNWRHILTLRFHQIAPMKIMTKILWKKSWKKPFANCGSVKEHNIYDAKYFIGKWNIISDGWKEIPSQRTSSFFTSFQCWQVVQKIVSVETKGEETWPKVITASIRIQFIGLHDQCTD